MNVIPEKKTINTKFGRLEVPKQHILCRTPLGLKMTPYWQEQCVYMGQQGSATLEKLTSQDVSAKQIERICHAYGQLLGTDEIEMVNRNLTGVTDGVVYGMMDGSMVLTREDDWKEMKLARIFSGKELLSKGKKHNFIRKSTYVAHLGGKHPFLDKVEQVIGSTDSMVWVADGAKWIWNWVDDYYPDHHQILDFFHASEKLHAFAREAFKKEDEKQQWVEHQLELLKNNGVEIVMINVELIRCRGSAMLKQAALLTYYQNNTKRIQYGDYLQKGWNRK